MKTRESRTAGGQAGFALIIALLALLLLTLLGLTLATTTSTELRIDTNYRWSQQALYNAEAGMEVGRALLSTIGDGQLVLPAARAGSWDPDNPPFVIPVPRFAAVRNFEPGGNCDKWGNGAGYGAVLTDPNNAANPFENVNLAFGRQLNGTFTLWVRRELLFNGDGTLSDNPVGEGIVLTSEGSAPFTGLAAGPGLGEFQRANRAIRMLETQVTVREGCRSGGPQVSATGFYSCEALP